MPVSVATVFHEDLEKAFRNVLPLEALKILHVMADSMMATEKAVQSNHEVIMKLMKYISLMEPHRKEMEATIKRFDKQFDNQLAMSDAIKQDDD